jgi:hypothetical protein
MNSRSQSFTADVLSWRDRAILERMQNEIGLPAVKNL